MINRIKLINGEFVDLNNTQEMGFRDVNVVVRTITHVMHNVLEEWANIKLDKKGTAYGIRRYSRGLIFSKFLLTDPILHVVFIIFNFSTATPLSFWLLLATDQTF